MQGRKVSDFLKPQMALQSTFPVHNSRKQKSYDNQVLEVNTRFLSPELKSSLMFQD